MPIVDDPSKIFQRARAFHECAALIHNYMKKHGSFHHIPPFGVLSSFAMELYLKCLLRIEGCNPGKTHDLYELFRNLPAGTRATLRKCWKETLDQDPAFGEIVRESGTSGELDDELKHSKNAFELFRYDYEKEACAPWGYSLASFNNCLKKIIAIKGPEWSRKMNKPS